MRRRDPNVTMACSLMCSDLLKQRPLEVVNTRMFNYLIGVVLGDGCVGKKAVRVTVGLQDVAYLDVLLSTFRQGLGMCPPVRRNEIARAFSVDLGFLAAVRLFQKFKRGSLWVLDNIQDPDMVLAGICDTDGGWEKKKGRRVAFCITQKDNGNLEKTLPLWAGLGFHPSLKHYAPNRAVLRILSIERDRFLKVVPLLHPRKIPESGFSFLGAV